MTLLHGPFKEPVVIATNEPSGSSKPRSSLAMFRRALTVTCAVLGGSVLLMTMLIFVLLMLFQGDNAKSTLITNREYYETLVGAVSARLGQEEGRVTFVLPSDGNIGNLRPLEEGTPDLERRRLGSELRLVHSRRISDGRLTVSVRVSNGGRSGLQALFYSTGNPSNEQVVIETGSDSASMITGNWWALEYRD